MDPSLRRIRDLARQDSQQTAHSPGSEIAYDTLFGLEGIEPPPVSEVESAYDEATTQSVGLLPGEWLIMPEIDVAQFVREHQGLREVVQKMANSNPFGICPRVEFSSMSNSVETKPVLQKQTQRRSSAVYPNITKKESRRRSTSDFTSAAAAAATADVATSASVSTATRPQVPSLKLNKLGASRRSTLSPAAPVATPSPPTSGRSRRGNSSPAEPVQLSRRLSTSSAYSPRTDEPEVPTRPHTDRDGRRNSLPAAPPIGSPSLNVNRSRKQTEMPSLKQAARRRTMQIIQSHGLPVVGDDHPQPHARKPADVL